MEKCTLCGHQWHGLVCSTTMTKTLPADPGSVITEKCKCPGPFDEGPRAKPTKGYW